MVVKKYIEENLVLLDKAYRRETDTKRALYFSKLAILELCGWIESSMDDLVLEHCARKVSNAANSKLVENNVKKTYGFSYDSHFRKMLIGLIGIVECERIEGVISSSALAKMQSQLQVLKTVRDGLAHTYIKGSNPITSVDAPSVTRSRLQDIYLGLKEFQRMLKSI